MADEATHRGRKRGSKSPNYKMRCPECGSRRVGKAGTRLYPPKNTEGTRRQQWLCKKCGFWSVYFNKG